MDEATLKDHTRATWGQLTDHDLPVTEGTEEDLADFLQKRSRYEKSVDENTYNRSVAGGTG
jgi:hypothetical protein